MIGLRTRKLSVFAEVVRRSIHWDGQTIDGPELLIGRERDCQVRPDTEIRAASVVAGTVATLGQRFLPSESTSIMTWRSRKPAHIADAGRSRKRAPRRSIRPRS